ncbi:DegT/DnrJ/EryC1/StrS family aminotransferase [Carnobacterium mobile]|uniref:DegT/DnrJ/EryC1/StrS family aminotransferase n=1 Tax=Carnobacterium mobile TaxID=2750 RepID=UPI00068D3172|nr:DegT/DnrJ/EryC1/StrS family aminotransferase [Carnobacterium mobile]
MSKIEYVKLSVTDEKIRERYLEEIDNVLQSGSFILGKEVELFENVLAEYLNCKHVISVGNGTDALFLSLSALGIGEGDEVITVANSFIATSNAIKLVGATPVFIDVDDSMNLDPNCINKAITNRTKAIIPVHLAGLAANIEEIIKFAQNNNLLVIEDCAQAIGVKVNNKMVGNFGDFGCFSLHPLKNLSVFGDGGFITTNDTRLFEKVKLLRNHGLINRDTSIMIGGNSRLDEMQAVLGRLNLEFLNSNNRKRVEYATFYKENLKEYPITFPHVFENTSPVFNTFMIFYEDRNKLREYLKQYGIETKIHYPKLITEQKLYLNERKEIKKTIDLNKKILSLPIHPKHEFKEIEYIVYIIKKFFDTL